METQWNLDEVKGYLRTWSASQRFLAAHGADALIGVESGLDAAWGDAADKKRIIWPVHLRAGRRF